MAAQPLKRKLVVLEEGALTAMALNPAVAKEFPVLSAVAALAKKPRRPGCGSCGRAGQERAGVYQKAKAALASMDATRKRRLKDLLNAASVRIIYKDGGGRAHELTF